MVKAVGIVTVRVSSRLLLPSLSLLLPLFLILLLTPLSPPFLFLRDTGDGGGDEGGRSTGGPSDGTKIHETSKVY